MEVSATILLRTLVHNFCYDTVKILPNYGYEWWRLPSGLEHIYHLINIIESSNEILRDN